MREGGGDEGEEGLGYFQESILIHAGALDYRSHASRKEMVEQCRERKGLHMVFIDLEKAHDKVPMEVP